MWHKNFVIQWPKLNFFCCVVNYWALNVCTLNLFRKCTFKNFMQAALPSTISSIQTAKRSNGPDNLTVISSRGLQATATKNLLWSHKQLQSWCNYCLCQRGLMRTMIQNEHANMSFQHQTPSNCFCCTCTLWSRARSKQVLVGACTFGWGRVDAAAV